MLDQPMSTPTRHTPQMMGSMLLAKLITAIIVLVVGAFLLRSWVLKPTLPKGLSNDALKAVFLDNGQVYFGEVETPNKDFLLIKNPYYLQTRTVLQEPVEEGKEPQKRQQLSLAALGGPGLQLHGPTKEMYIPWSSVMYLENLRDDSSVVKLIKAELEKGDSSAGKDENANEDANANTNTNSEQKAE